MAKLSRVTQKIFAGNAEESTIGQFGSALSGSKVLTGDIEEIQALDAFEGGWSKAVISKRNYPTLQEMNGLQKVFSQQIAYGFQEGMPEYDAGTTYYTGSWCKGVDDAGQRSIYESLVDDNLGNPLTDETKWKKVQLGGGSNYVGQLIPALFPIENELGVTPREIHLTDGTTISSVEYSGFAAWLDKIVAKYPAFSKTEEEWQALKTQYGEVPCFVIDKSAETIRLPLIVNPIKGVTDLSQLAKMIEAGLPNITGNLIDLIGGINSSSNGAFVQTRKENGKLYGTNSGPNWTDFNFDASKSNSIYGNSDTVQPQQPTGCYYLVLATGVDQNVKEVQEIQLNTPYNLLDIKWSDKILNNPSWLRSMGQANSNEIYPAVYNFILEQYNSGEDTQETVGGQEITFRRGTNEMKITTNKAAYDAIYAATGSSWYYVLDTSSQEFYLPRSNNFLQFAAENPGDFNEAGLPNITGKTSHITTDYTTNAWVGTGAFYKDSSQANLGSPSSSGHYAVAIGFDASKSNSIYGSSDTVQPASTNGFLYFYVGETIVNPQLIDAGKALEKLAEKVNSQQAANAAMPGDKYVDLTLQASGTTYTAPADGYFTINATSGGTDKFVYMNNTTNSLCTISHVPKPGNTPMLFLPAKKGDVVKIGYDITGKSQFRFVYAQGAAND